MQLNNQNNKSTSYPSNSYEAYVPTPMSSSQQYISSEFPDMVQPNISSALVSENTLSVTHVQQTGILLLIII